MNEQLDPKLAAWTLAHGPAGGETVQLDEAQRYYNYVSSVVAFIVLFLFAYAISFVALYFLRRFFRRLKHEEGDDEDDIEFERRRGRLPFLLSTFIFAVSLMWLIVIIVTLPVQNQNDEHFNNWRSHRSVQRYWLFLIWMSVVALFVVAPFAFIYYEAEGFGRAYKGYAGSAARCTETWTVLLLLICLVRMNSFF